MKKYTVKVTDNTGKVMVDSETSLFLLGIKEEKDWIFCTGAEKCTADDIALFLAKAIDYIQKLVATKSKEDMEIGLKFLIYLMEQKEKRDKDRTIDNEDCTFAN